MHQETDTVRHRRGLIAARCLVLFLLTSPLKAWDGDAEEPDYFFLTGGPYTQKKNSPQWIWANQWSWTGAGGNNVREYTGAGRFEIGLTDRWEADFEFGALHVREESAGSASTQGGVADFLVGARYRLLDESFAPFALTLGPQLALPAASRERGLGNGEVGYGFDVTAAKDWGGPVFLAASLNILWTPDVPAPDSRSVGRSNLTDIGAAVALAWRALERSTEERSHHDLHVFLEAGWERTESPAGEATASSQGWVVSPGLRYGHLGGGGSLTEIGVALPFGLYGDAPDWGWIFQLQVELPSLR